MTEQLTIRPAIEADCGIILEFIQELAEFEKLSHQVVATEATLKATLFTPDAKAEVIIAENAGQPVGFALYFYSYSTFLSQPGLYLEDLYVRPTARGQGIGQTMLSYLAKIAKDNNCGRFEWTVLDWNEKAISLYRRMGAEPMTEWTVQRVSGDELSSLAAKWVEQS